MENKTSHYEKTERGKYKDDTRHTILSHSGVNCHELTKDEFAAMMVSDMAKANGLYQLEIAAEKEEMAARRTAQAEASYRKYAESKWRTEKRRQQYVDEMMGKFKVSFYGDDELRNFRNEFIPDTMYGYTMQNGDEDSVKSVFKTCCLDNKFWHLATGWRITYKSRDDSKFATNYPHVELLVDEATAAEMKRRSDRLSQSVSDFYKDSNYWGD